MASRSLDTASELRVPCDNSDLLLLLTRRKSPYNARLNLDLVFTLIGSVDAPYRLPRHRGRARPLSHRVTDVHYGDCRVYASFGMEYEGKYA